MSLGTELGKYRIVFTDMHSERIVETDDPVRSYQAQRYYRVYIENIDEKMPIYIQDPLLSPLRLLSFSEKRVVYVEKC